MIADVVGYDMILMICLDALEDGLYSIMCRVRLTNRPYAQLMMTASIERKTQCYPDRHTMNGRSSVNNDARSGEEPPSISGMLDTNTHHDVNELCMQPLGTAGTGIPSKGGERRQARDDLIPGRWKTLACTSTQSYQET